MCSKIASACITGNYHAQQGLPCQDKSAFCVKDTATAIALADGAGSKAFSHVGAACAANTCVRLLTDDFDALRLLTDDALRRKIVGALQAELRLAGHPFEALGCTLLFAAFSNKHYLCGHLGDGAIISYFGSAALLSHPENGQYPNQTFFITDNDASAHLRLYRGKILPNSGFMLMTDGACASLHNAAAQTLSPACAQLFEWLCANSESAVSQALAQNMASQFARKSNDDLGLIMAITT